jgi:hypothetical protein
MKQFAANLTGALVEAWQEVRIHKTRVMMSLIGVAVAVCAITTVVGLGAVAQQAGIQQQERQGGRPANLSMSARCRRMALRQEPTRSKRYGGWRWNATTSPHATRISRPSRRSSSSMARSPPRCRG